MGKSIMQLMKIITINNLYNIIKNNLIITTRILIKILIISKVIKMLTKKTTLTKIPKLKTKCKTDNRMMCLTIFNSKVLMTVKMLISNQSMTVLLFHC